MNRCTSVHGLHEIASTVPPCAGGMVWRMKGECKQSLGRMITFSPRIDLFSSLLYPGPGETQSEPGTKFNIFELRHFWLKFEPPI